MTYTWDFEVNPEDYHQGGSKTYGLPLGIAEILAFEKQNIMDYRTEFVDEMIPDVQVVDITALETEHTPKATTEPIKGGGGGPD